MHLPTLRYRKYNPDGVMAHRVVGVEMGRDGLRVGRLVSFGQIARKWLFGLCGIAWKNMMEMGRGGACVPARVALQGRIHRSIPRTQHVYFFVWKRRYADVRAGTQAPPLRFRLGGLRVGGWRGWGGLRVNGYLVCVGLRRKI